jgi:hypothetical protein
MLFRCVFNGIAFRCTYVGRQENGFFMLYTEGSLPKFSMPIFLTIKVLQQLVCIAEVQTVTTHFVKITHINAPFDETTVKKMNPRVYLWARKCVVILSH